MKKLVSWQARIIVDILMLTVLIPVFVFSKDDIHWKSLHCIMGVAMIFLMLVHIAQNWKFIKSLIKKNVMRRNKTIVLIALIFIPVLITVIAFAFGVFGMVNLKLHHLFGQLFVLLIIIHVITKAKRFVNLFKKAYL
jgi:hypothetical protein